MHTFTAWYTSTLFFFVCFFFCITFALFEHTAVADILACCTITYTLCVRPESYSVTRINVAHSKITAMMVGKKTCLLLPYLTYFFILFFIFFLFCCITFIVFCLLNGDLPYGLKKNFSFLKLFFIKLHSKVTK